MAHTEFGTGKSLVVLAIVLGCFAILWPKIFYPMMQTAFAMTSPNIDADGRYVEHERLPPHLHPAGSSRARGQHSEDINDKFMMRDGRPFPHPQVRQPPKAQPKTGGTMGIVMPIYTVGICVFFLYTVLKIVFKKPPEEGDKKPLIKDFHMDPEYHKFVCGESSFKPTAAKKPSKEKTIDPDTPPADEKSSTQEVDPKDFEIFKLKKKLEDTEVAMERIMSQMGMMSSTLNERVMMEKKLSEAQNSNIRQRHKGSTPCESTTTVVEEGETLNTDDNSSLEDDLAELINLCNETGKTLKGYRNMEEVKNQELADEDQGPEDYYVDEVEDVSDYEEDDEDEAQLLKDDTRCGTDGCCDNMACS